MGEIDDDEANIAIIQFISNFYRNLSDYKFEKYLLRDDLEQIICRSLMAFEGQASIRWIVVPRQI